MNSGVSKTPPYLVGLKWALLAIVALLLILNYFALKDVVLEVIGLITPILNSLGYYLDITKPASFVFDRLIPYLGLFGFIIKGKNVLYTLQQIYDKITFPQLLILVVCLPILLLFQNKLYSKTITNGTK